MKEEKARVLAELKKKYEEGKLNKTGMWYFNENRACLSREGFDMRAVMR